MKNEKWVLKQRPVGKPNIESENFEIYLHRLFFFIILTNLNKKSTKKINPGTFLKYR